MCVCVYLPYTFHKCLFIHIHEFQKPCVSGMDENKLKKLRTMTE